MIVIKVYSEGKIFLLDVSETICHASERQFSAQVGGTKTVKFVQTLERGLKSIKAKDLLLFRKFGR